MPHKILLITPPFTQLNTPYPATPYLKGFLQSRGYEVFQADLGIELINRIFSREGFRELFEFIKNSHKPVSLNSQRMLQNEQIYVETIDAVMDFLQYRDNTLASLIARGNYLPRASRFDQMPDLEWSFGSIGLNDKARFLATRYIEDMGDLIKDAVTPYFGFSRYAEKLGIAAHSFSPINDALLQPGNIIEAWMLELLKSHVELFSPDVAGLTIPFPGNLYASFKCAQFLKKQYPGLRIIAGGGFVNTELRELSDPAVFDYLDFVTLDDGELPFLCVLKFLEGKKPPQELVRTFARIDDQVEYFAGREKDRAAAGTGCPDYSDLPLDKYLSLIEIANPMHRLWSDGRWNKLAVAHGCYWHQCSFCDTTLDYIKRCSALPAGLLVDWIEQVISQTGQTGFHFVDEAAPPSALRELALELLRRKRTISWWANIRFETAFTPDLCRLLAASGCVAVSGGLEAASDRLLKLMKKGVTVRQAAQACRNLSEAGIMAHAYLMYGFPTQTAQETVDALEIVRQFFENGLIQSGFWHLFTATVHSDVGRNPEKYGITIADRPAGTFANNDLEHEDPSGCDHLAFAPGLNKALYNFMHGIGMELPVEDWFDFRIPRVGIKKNFIRLAINEKLVSDRERMKAKLAWLETLPRFVQSDAPKKGKAGIAGLEFATRQGTISIPTEAPVGEWLSGLFERFSVQNRELPELGELKKLYENTFASSFDLFLRSREWKAFRANGLLLI